MKPIEIKKKFLEDNAEYLLSEYKRVLRGDGDGFACQYDSVRKEMWQLLEEVIKKTAYVDSVTVESTADLIAMLKAGTVDIDTAVKLMDLLKTRQDIEELPKLSEQLADMIKQNRG